MNQEQKEQILASVRDFSLPRYDQIPNVGLYLEQTAKYITEAFARLGDISLTGSMISNYVKMGLVANPVKKQYGREQIAYLIFIAVAKSVMSMEDIRLLFTLQKRAYTPQVAYDYFCNELENVLFYVFGLKETLDTVGVSNTETKALLRNTIITVAHKVYLDKHFAALHQEKNSQNH